MSEQEDVREHLAKASEEEVLAYREVARLLRAASPLQRATCPSAEDLVVAADELSPGQAQARGTHVAACPACRDDLRDFAALGELQPSAVATAVAAVRAKLVLGLRAATRALEVLETTLTLAPMPQLAPARGDAAPSALAQRAPFGEGELEVRWVLARGAVDLEAVALEGAPRPYRLILAHEDGGILEVRTADDAGVVRLSGLEPGAYELRVHAPQRATPGLSLSLELRQAK